MLNRLELTQISLRHMKAAMEVMNLHMDTPSQEAEKIYDILINLVADLDEQMKHNESK